jgi:hypothetical protein
LHADAALKVVSFGPNELVDTAYALGKLRRRAPRLPLPGAARILDKVAAAAALLDLALFSTHQLARLAWAVATWESTSGGGGGGGGGDGPWLPLVGRSLAVRKECMVAIGVEAARRLGQGGSRADAYYAGSALHWKEAFLASGAASGV